MQRRRFLHQLSALGLTACGAANPTPGPAPERRAPRASPTRHLLALPPRAAGSEPASDFVDRLAGLRPGAREEAIVMAVTAGNVPDFLRRLVRVPLEAGKLRAFAFVTPDYVSVGSEQDWVRVPMTIRGARRIARAASCLLPTRLLVDRIHEAAATHIASPYMPPGRDMASVDYFVAHHAAIENHRKHARPGELLSGHKKDLVISRRELSTPSRTPIYGWFRADGSAIQSLSLLHDRHYVDYAHGVRLVAQSLEIEGREISLLDALADRDLCELVSDEGRFDYRAIWARGY